MSFFDGLDLGIKIDYSLEETSNPLSTIAPLTLIQDLPENFLVMNGDIITDLNFEHFLNQHIQSRQEVSVSTYKRDSKIDFGVIETNQAGEIVGFREKPTYHFEVSMGVYALNKKVVMTLEKGKKYGFDNLMLDGLKNDKRYVAIPFNGLWMDLGRGEDYDYCNEHYPEIKAKLGI
jgi:NDP-mannose synthase